MVDIHASSSASSRALFALVAKAEARLGRVSIIFFNLTSVFWASHLAPTWAVKVIWEHIDYNTMSFWDQLLYFRFN